MGLWTTEYADLQKRFHVERDDYGCSGGKHVEFVRHLSDQMNTRDILDYACGKATLQKGLPFPIQNYDPFVAEYMISPRPADIVVCTDVMEHIEEPYVDDVLKHLRQLTKQILYMNVATGPARKILPDGRNAHITQHNSHWWLMRMLSHFDLQSFQHSQGSFVCILVPPQPEPQPE